MASDIALRVENIGKMYRIGAEKPQARTMAGRIGQTLVSPFDWLTSQMRGASENETLWAVRDVSFEVKCGEVVGIIGSNGAGKSTLLKLLSRITEPTEGRAEVYGRLAALLEVGTGMHPELTGRENIYLNGCILGMRKWEVKAKFDEIVAFSGIEKFIDTQVKRYSSGMRVRLGFAIAAHLEPEILIVDEVLAVGDAEFQRKCLGKMQDVAGEGRTVLFVSHNMQAMKSLCSRAVEIQAGRLVYDDKTAKVIEHYLHRQSHQCPAQDINSLIRNLPPDEAFRLDAIYLSQNGKPVETHVSSGVPVEIDIRYSVLKQTTGLRIIVDLLDADQTLLFRSFHDEDADGIPTMLPGQYSSRVSIPCDLLGPLQYDLRVQAGIHAVRMCLPGTGIRIPISVVLTGKYNRAYSRDRFCGKLAVALAWSSEKTGNK